MSGVADRADAPLTGQPVAELFCELVRIASPSRREGAMARFVCAMLARHDIAFQIDDSAAATGSETGNVIARVAGSPDAPTVLVLAHMDTVQPEGVAIEPVLGDDGVLRSAGDTILGADNKGAVAALLTVLTSGLTERANVVAVFSTCEERGVMGASQLAGLAAEVDMAFPIDGSHPIGTVLEAALGQTPFGLRIHGREAHAARAPEEGVHALRVAAEIVAGLELGTGEDTILNVSAIDGGSETNIVPGLVEMRGEVRAYSTEAIDRRLAEIEAFAAQVANRAGATIELIARPHDGAPPLSSSANRECVAIARAAAVEEGLELVVKRCSETLEANFLDALGIPTLGVASGGRNPHSPQESIVAADIARLVAFVESLLRNARAISAAG